MPTQTIVVRPGEPGRVLVRVPYSAERLAAIKSFPDRRWLPTEKLWSLADAPDILIRLRAAFPGDEIDSPQAVSAVATSPDPLRRTQEVMRARHMSPHTVDAYLGWVRRFLSSPTDRNPVQSHQSEPTWLSDLYFSVFAYSRSSSFRRFCSLHGLAVFLA